MIFTSKPNITRTTTEPHPRSVVVSSGHEEVKMGISSNIKRTGYDSGVMMAIAAVYCQKKALSVLALRVYFFMERRVDADRIANYTKKGISESLEVNIKYVEKALKLLRKLGWVKYEENVYSRGYYVMRPQEAMESGVAKIDEDTQDEFWR